MATYRDYSFNHGNFSKAEEVTDASAVVLAIKNIILSRPGNFPFTPSLGIDIEKYAFELGDEKTLEQIKSDISEQIGRFLPSLENVYVNVILVDDTNDNLPKGRKILGISVRSSLNDESVEANFLLYNDYDGLHIYNEVKN